MAQKSSGGMAKNVLMVLFIIAACGFVWMQLRKRAAIKQESEAVQTYNDGKYEEAIKLFEKLQANARGDAVQRHRTNLAKCYVGLAEQENLPVAEQVKLYERACEYDDQAITNPTVLKLLESSRRKREMSATTSAEDASAPAGNQ